MISQQIRQDETNMSGTLTITAEPGYLAELLAVYIELSGRSNVYTNGTVTILPPQEPPTEEEPTS